MLVTVTTTGSVAAASTVTVSGSMVCAARVTESLAPSADSLTVHVAPSGRPVKTTGSALVAPAGIVAETTTPSAGAGVQARSMVMASWSPAPSPAMIFCTLTSPDAYGVARTPVRSGSVVVCARTSFCAAGLSDDSVS